ncbi:MAG: alpha/beta hydrolase [Burkholderiales bacterium]
MRGPLLAVSLSIMSIAPTAGKAADKLEQTVCGWLREPLAFALWSRAAGRPADKVAQRVGDARIEAISHRTADGRLLHGYRLRPDAARIGFVLVAQGNAMLADHLLDEIAPLTAGGREVYIFDYRGYGASEGRPRLKAIVADYIQIASALEKSPGGPANYYGISFGGIVLSNVVGAGANYARLVIDSSPARVSPFGCPRRYDPVEHLPADTSGILLVRGERDTVVPPAATREFADVVQARGGRVLTRRDFAHPFMDFDFTVHAARQALIRSFLLGESK